jgi:hypothetical protein
VKGARLQRREDEEVERSLDDFAVVVHRLVECVYRKLM